MGLDTEKSISYNDATLLDVVFGSHGSGPDPTSENIIPFRFTAIMHYKLTSFQLWSKTSQTRASAYGSSNGGAPIRDLMLSVTNHIARRQ